MIGLVFLCLAAAAVSAQSNFIADLKVEGDKFSYHGRVYDRLAVGDVGFKVKDMKGFEVVDDTVAGKVLRVFTNDFQIEVPLSRMHIL